MDRLQELEAFERDQALQRVRDRIEESFRPRADGIDGLCIDCDKPIEPKRLQVLAGKTSRCAGCAQKHEQQLVGDRR
ncbi:TraR/DksA C4-type zinc finger protein [Frateuria sp. YIM B11624]|uniref:TraR/DksA C4-type zinc finger protein n=1 Tax=Frateuria sp. YIM B11624 TaxID=3143185 RepID=UPI003C738DEA